MKKEYIFLLLLALTAGLSARAQYADQYYHRIGDVVEWRNPICYYQWWDAEYNYNNRLMFHLYYSELTSLFNGIRLCRYYTPDTLKVIGLCMMGHTLLGRACDSMEYLYLYDADGTDFVLKAQVPWREPRLDSCRYLYLKQHVRGGSGWDYVDTSQCYGVTALLSGDSCCVTCSHQHIYNMYEYYFDTGVYVTDSFYVGGSSFSFYSSPNTIYPLYMVVGVQDGVFGNPHGKSCKEPGINNGQAPDCWPPRMKYRMWLADTLVYRLNGIDHYANIFHLPYREWAWREFCEYLLIVPIIQVDTTVPVWNYCPPVENVQVSLVEDSCLILTWDDCVNYSSVTVRYGVTPEGGTTQWHEIETEDNIFRLCGIDTLSEYRFTLRAHCDTSKQETDWSEELMYQYPVRHDVGIGDTPLSRHTHLVPNPAHESVLVNTGYTLRRIEVYNSRGILVYSEPAWGMTATIDLTGWPSGSYIVVVGTQKGRTAKVLVKE